MTTRPHAQVGRRWVSEEHAVVECRCGHIAAAPSMSKARAEYSEHYAAVRNDRPLCIKCGEKVGLEGRNKNRTTHPDGTAQHVHCTYQDEGFKRDRGREDREHRDAVAHAWFAGDVTGRR